MPATALLGDESGAGEKRVRHLRFVRPATIGPRASILEALGLLMREPSGVLLTSHRGRPAVLTQGDVERVLPSTASSLARDELTSRVERVRVADAIPGATATLEVDASLGTAVEALRRSGWRP